MREFLERVQWLPVAVVCVGVAALSLSVVGDVRRAAVFAVVALAGAVLARGEA